MTRQVYLILYDFKETRQDSGQVAYSDTKSIVISIKEDIKLRNNYLI